MRHPGVQYVLAGVKLTSVKFLKSQKRTIHGENNQNPCHHMMYCHFEKMLRALLFKGTIQYTVFVKRHLNKWNCKVQMKLM